MWTWSADAARPLADRHGAAACAGFDALVERCEAVVLAVPPVVQEEYAARAARAHRALLLEKPLGADIAGAEELAAAVLRTGVPTRVALPWRHTTDVQRFLDQDVPGADPVGGTVTGPRPHGFDISHGLHLQRLVEAAATDLLLHG